VEIINKIMFTLIKNFLRAKVIESIKKADRKYEENLWGKMPQHELKDKNIKNLKVVTNRKQMLNYFPKNSIGAEIGTAKGDFAKDILDTIRPKKLYLIDSWETDEENYGNEALIRRRFVKEISKGLVFVKRGKSLPELRKFSDNSLDWVYIDTNHNYKLTKNELIESKRIVKNTGFIAGHDYVTGAWLDRIRFGVVEAVNEFCVKYNYEVILLSNESHRHISYVLKKIT
jgi:hypothetical protein